ncbi:hypothetical protein [Niabella drilacis]|uniref:Lipoprotein n=1 Tax=Niabella drilacis (strain DSM 25811 / CCM 8410 / CCUG 62505 / LMG 26954 / E90) TaxID=1285928 RepID=A0A1G6KYJ1_NIADE|nr:hypothetical protein [Niabella drilacis]SDC35426.1 hypothetical protein SAMN04487894_102130 [Niabella drilacis]
MDQSNKLFSIIWRPLLACCLLFASCQKEDLQPETIIDPVEGRVLAADTLRSGSLLGMQIGENHEAVYEKIRQIGIEKNIDILWVTNPQFSGIEVLKGKLGYYSDLRLSSQWVPSDYILFQIENDRIKAIYNPEGRQLPKWPAGRQYRYTINVGDPASQVYNKMLELQSMKKYKDYFTAISAFAKLISKPYDSRMSASSEWYLNYRQPDQKNITRNTLLFKEGVLKEIRTLVQAAP